MSDIDMNKKVTLYEHLQDVRTAALRASDSFTFTKIGTVLGESKQIATKKENRDPTDEEIVGVIKKTLEGIAEVISYEKDDDKKMLLLKERQLLQGFMPTQLSETEVRVIIKNSGLKDMKSIMQLFKTNYQGKYDGKQVSTIAKELA
jgi:uncharacterized protein YqeY